MGRRSSVAGKENGGRSEEGGAGRFAPAGGMGPGTGLATPGGATIGDPHTWQNRALSGTEAPQALQNGIMAGMRAL